MSKPVRFHPEAIKSSRHYTARFCSVCSHVSCICDFKVQHKKNCKFLIAATCAIGIACEHNRDVCSICDPCTCKR